MREVEFLCEYCNNALMNFVCEESFSENTSVCVECCYCRHKTIKELHGRLYPGSISDDIIFEPTMFNDPVTGFVTRLRNG